MDKTISQQLDETFQRASESYIRNLLKSDSDKAEFAAIKQAADDRQKDLSRRYEEEYPARVEAARQRLYDKAATRKLDHPAPAGLPTVDANFIDRQAHHEVRLRHEAEMQEVREETERAFEELLARAHQRNETKHIATEAYLRASDRRSVEDRRRDEERRSGNDRRKPKQSRD